MARNVAIRILRTTRANLNTQISGSGLLVGEPYLITDESRVAIATATNTVVELAKRVDEQAATIVFVIDGGGQAIAAGQKVDLPDLPFACTVTGWTITADASGSAVVSIHRATYANFPTFTEISGTEDPTLSAAQKNQDLTLTTWTTSLSVGDVLRANVESATTVQRLTVTLRVTKA